MKEETFEGSEITVGSGRTGKTLGRVQPEAVMHPPEDPGRGMQLRWEAQWQDFLKTLQAAHSAWRNPKMSEATPWEDAKAFLASFEQVATACRWPRREWVALLLPALSGDAQQAFSLLAARDKEDYGKVKAAILRGDALRRETERQQFRQFCCSELGDPRRMYSQVQELCCQWLKPERHTKEQILELLVLEQFLASLPVDVQSWIRAGGPDSGAQVVALLEDFLLSRTEADTGMWQEPFQEWAVGLLDAKEECLDKVKETISTGHSEIFGNTQQNVEGEAALPGLGITRSTLLLPPENQDMDDEAEQSTELDVQVDQVTTPKKIGVPLHLVERTLMQSSQQTMFWKVLPEDGENVDFLDVGMGTHLKVRNAQLREDDELTETPRTGGGGIQENVPAMTEVKEERCEANREQETEPFTGCKETVELPEDLGATFNDPSPVGTGEDPPLGGKVQPKSKLDNLHNNQIDEQNHDLPVLRLYPNPLATQQKIHTGEKNYVCSDCGKSFSRRSNLLAHQMIHTGNQPHQCPDCGKSFSQRSPLLKHQRIHTGEKPHQCPDCGKSFSQRSSMLTHQIIHTGKKPHKCSDCGKGFSRRFILLMHQSTHTGEKPHKCSECGKSFSQRSHLLIHQAIHTEKKPHQCPECDRSFLWRSQLLMHQSIHTGEKPHKCPECGKNFSRKSTLLDHQMSHTGMEPFQCGECGRNFFSRSNLRRHQSIHIGEKPHKCPVCDKGFSQRSHLLRHQNTHNGEKPYKNSGEEPSLHDHI